MLYLNGEHHQTETFSYTKNISNSTIHIGDRIEQNQHFWGEIDDFRIYDKALSAYEIVYLANNMVKLGPQAITGTTEYKTLTFTYDETRYPTIDADATNLVAWYKFDGGQ